MKKKSTLIILGIFVLFSVTAITFSDITKDKFKDKVKELDATELCLKEDSLDVKFKKCDDGEKIKDIDTPLLMESKELGMVMISNLQ